MEDLVEILDTDIDTDRLKDEIGDLLDRFLLHDKNQISLTSLGGNNDWDCSIGRLADLPNPERFYSTINRALEGTLIEKYIKKHRDFYRWRLLRLQPRHTYTVHTDNLNTHTMNLRLHIPVITNPDCYMCFFEEAIQAGATQPVRFEHLEAGNSYITNTTGLHTAVNYGLEDRYHIVGVRYEKNI